VVVIVIFEEMIGIKMLKREWLKRYVATDISIK